IFATFRPREERSGADHQASAIVRRVGGALSRIPDAIIVPFEPPPIRGVGNLGGFEAQILDRGNAGLRALEGAVYDTVGRAAQRPDLARVFSSFSAADPQLRVEIDRDRARALGVPVDQALGALQVLVGSAYVNDFELLHRSYRVFVQAEGDARSGPEDIGAMYVQSRSGERIPLSVILRQERATAPQIIKHFDLHRAATLNGGAAAGRSSGEALAAIGEVLEELPAGFDYAFSGLSLEQTEAGSETQLLLALGLFLSFLVLAAQYESFTLPAVILASVPTSLFGALLGLFMTGIVNDVFAQIGLLLLAGLASKNAILIVEFAHQLELDEGLSPLDAATKAALLRLRPILMTSFAFILGILPLVFATGASEFARRSLGTTVFFGMLVSTVLNSFFVPAVYVLVVRVSARLRRRFAGIAAAGPEVVPDPAE
ncbi:MAG: efflux RND transporter permease subunit, partial [Polyangiaceae bacterium]|nr:efflux RND transporter permease subunit [Polyangiaceae bacterium]